MLYSLSQLLPFLLSNGWGCIFCKRGVFGLKKKFYTELAYIVGLLTLAFGAALMTMADFGLSMIVAPAYILHLKLSQTWSFFTFGMAEYTLQAVLLLITVGVLRRFRVSYLLSFVTAFIYGMLLDGFIELFSTFSFEALYLRVAAYVLGLLFTSFGVTMFFRTYLSPEVYELLVKEVSKKFGVTLSRFKTFYDCGSLVVSVIMTFSFFGLWEFRGIGWGTLVCALVNGWLIGRATKILDKHFEFTDGLRWRKFFE